MSEHKFTKAPWEADMAVDHSTGKETFAIYHEPSPGHIVEVVETPDFLGDDCIHGKDTSEKEANANLIAAAPDLLEALETLQGCIELYLPEVKGSKAMIKAEIAIKKALGE